MRVPTHFNVLLREDKNATAIAEIGSVCIGACDGTPSLVCAALRRRLPVRNPERLVLGHRALWGVSDNTLHAAAFSTVYKSFDLRLGLGILQSVGGRKPAYGV